MGIEIKTWAIPRRHRRSAAAVVEHVPWIFRKQQDIADPEMQRLAAGRIVQYGGAADNRVVGDFAGVTGPLLDAPATLT